MARMNQPDAIVSTAPDLAAALSSEERRRRLLGALGRVIHCDAAAVSGLEEGELLPIVAEGLSADASLPGTRDGVFSSERLSLGGRTEPACSDPGRPGRAAR